eukprot:8561203-Alexandrium_andersonii.AAC.1
MLEGLAEVPAPRPVGGKLRGFEATPDEPPSMPSARREPRLDQAPYAAAHSQPLGPTPRGTWR